MNNTLARWITRARYPLLLLSVAFVVTLSAGISRIVEETDYKLFFEDDDPVLLAYEQQQDEYTRAENVMFLVVAPGGDVFTARNLAMVEELTAAAWHLPEAIRVDSVTNFQWTQSVDEDLLVEPLFEYSAQIPVEEIARRRSFALASDEIADLLVSKKGDVTAVNVRLALEKERPECDGFNAQCEDVSAAQLSLERGEATRRVIQSARELKQRIAVKYGAEIYLLGSVPFDITFTESTDKDMATLIPLMLLVVAVLVFWFLRSMIATFLTLFTLGASVAMLMGAAGWFGFTLNMITSLAPVVIITLAVCDCVHFFVGYFTGLKKGFDSVSSVRYSLEVNLQPIVLTSVTTAIGFLALNFSESPPFQAMGTIAAVGVMSACIITITLLPGLVTLFRLDARKSPAMAGLNLERVANLVTQKPVSVLLVTSAVALILTALVPLNVLSDSGKQYFHKGTELRDGLDLFDERLSGASDIGYSLSAGEANDSNDPEYLAQIERFVTWLREQPEVAYAGSYVDVLKRINRDLHGGEPGFYRVPGSRAEAAQYQLLYELSLPQGLDLNSLVNQSKSALKVVVNVRDKRARELLLFDQRVQRWIAENMGGLEAAGAGIDLMFGDIGQRNILSMVKGSFLAVLLIAVALMIFFRSFSMGLFSVIPNAVPCLMAMGVWAVTNGTINLAVATVFSISLGLVVDNTVHFLSKYLRARRYDGASVEQAVGYAFGMVGKALVVTTAALAGGFSMLALSDFAVFSSMGILVALTIVIALVFDLLFLPAALVLGGRFKTGGAFSGSLPVASASAKL